MLSSRASGVLNTGDLQRFCLKAMGLGESLAVEEQRVPLWN